MGPNIWKEYRRFKLKQENVKGGPPRVWRWIRRALTSWFCDSPPPHPLVYVRVGSVVSDSLQPHRWYLPDFSVCGILQAKIPEWVAIPYFRGFSWPVMESTSLASSTLAGGFFTVRITWEAQCRYRYNGQLNWNREYVFQADVMKSPEMRWNEWKIQ